MIQMHELDTADAGMGHESPQGAPALAGGIELLHRARPLERHCHAANAAGRLDAFKRIGVQLLPLNTAPQGGLQPADLLAHRLRCDLVDDPPLGLIGLQLDRSQRVDGTVPKLRNDDAKLALRLLVRGWVLGLVPVDLGDLAEAQEVAEGLGGGGGDHGDMVTAGRFTVSVAYL